MRQPSNAGPHPLNFQLIIVYELIATAFLSCNDIFRQGRRVRVFLDPVVISSAYLLPNEPWNYLMLLHGTVIAPSQCQNHPLASDVSKADQGCEVDFYWPWSRFGGFARQLMIFFSNFAPRTFFVSSPAVWNLFIALLA